MLSISLQFQTKPDLKFTVSRKAFSPPPSVDSAVVHFDIPKKPRYAVNDEELFLQIVKSAFSQRRKTITNSLKAYQNINEALIYCKIDKSVRPEQLSIEQFAALSNNLE